MIKWKKIFWDAISPLPMVSSMERQHWYVGPPRELGELRHWFWLGLDVESSHARDRSGILSLLSKKCMDLDMKTGA